MNVSSARRFRLASGLVGRGSAQKPVTPAKRRRRMHAATFSGLGRLLSFDHRLGVVNPALLFVKMRHRRLGDSLKVRLQLLQRNRESPRERPQATIFSPAQCGQPRLSTRSWPLVPKTSGRRPRFAPLPVAPAAGAPVSVAPSTSRRPRSSFAKATNCPTLLRVRSRNPRKPDGKLHGRHRNPPPKTRQV